MEINLKSFALAPSTDKKRMKLILTDENGQSVDVIMLTENFEVFLQQLTQFNMQAKIQNAPSGDPSGAH